MIVTIKFQALPNSFIYLGISLDMYDTSYHKFVTLPLEPLTYMGFKANTGTQPPFFSLGTDDQPTSPESPPHRNST